MLTDTPIFKEDIENILGDKNIPWSKLDGKTVLVTGATGLIGFWLVNALVCYGKISPAPPRVLAFVRNPEKAKAMYAQYAGDDRLAFIEGDVCRKPETGEGVDYIIHAASETASSSFVSKPVETIHTALSGTKNMLELAREQKCKGFIFLSSMEAYGSPTDESPLTEDAPAYFSTGSVRSSYPESKRMCEVLTTAYAEEYSIPAKSIRLAQTFGPGVAKTDARVFADFSRKALSGEDIVFATKGDSKRMYLYTADAVRAILTVLLKGENGQCYNAANESSYCSILEMAQLVSELFSGGKSKIVFHIDSNQSKKFLATHRLRMDVSKLEGLGWMPGIPLGEMFERMVSVMNR